MRLLVNSIPMYFKDHTEVNILVFLLVLYFILSNKHKNCFFTDQKILYFVLDIMLNANLAQFFAFHKLKVTAVNYMKAIGFPPKKSRCKQQIIKLMFSTYLSGITSA